MQRASGVEVLLHGREEVFLLFLLALLGDPRVAERFVGCHALVAVDGETSLDELSCGQGHAPPVFERGEGVVGDEDGLHLFKVAVTVEGGVAAEKEVGYYAYGPDISGLLG